jgi:hypothetical protein
MPPAAGSRFSDAGAHLELLMPADQAVAGWRSLDPEPRWNWFHALYEQAAHLDRRYRLGLRSGWWEDDIQVEILATLGAWVAMFDYANWTDPEGKARLILQLPTVRELVRGGAQQFDPHHDRHAFDEHDGNNDYNNVPPRRVPSVARSRWRSPPAPHAARMGAAVGAAAPRARREAAVGRVA